MITELSPEQRARFPEFVEKWTKIGLSTEPANRPLAEEGIQLMYKEAGLKPPKIVWCLSPLANGVTRAIILKGNGASVGDSVRASVRASVGDSVWDSVRASVRASVWDSVRASVWDSVWDSVGDSVRASVRDSVRASVRASVWDSVRASVRASVGDSVGDSVWDSVRASVGDSVGASGYGQHDAEWLAFYDFFTQVCGLKNETQKLKGLWLQAQSAGWYLPHKNICWISERHNILHLNQRGRLHCENGLAVAYPDGWGIYALNGIRMKKEYVTTPAEDITTEAILKEENVDQRRELIRKVGVLKMVEQGKEIDQSGHYKLIDMSPIIGVRYAPFLLMLNPSVENTWHFEGVAPECRTVEQAINWRAGNIEIQWTPAMLS